MYRLGRREVNKKKRKTIRRIIYLILIIIAIGLYFYIKSLSVTHTQIKQSAAKITKITFVQGKTKIINEPNFSFSLPVSWEEASHDVNPYNVYRFRSTDIDSKDRLIDIYEDKLPTGIAVNRVLAIESGSSTNRITLRGEVSDNCQDYTKATGSIAPGTYGTKAKWKGIDFYCDLANYQRNVVGTGSPDAINRVNLTGPQTGDHSYFFLYTENSFAPDYSILYSAVQSFALK